MGIPKSLWAMSSVHDMKHTMIFLLFFRVYLLHFQEHEPPFWIMI